MSAKHWEELPLGAILTERRETPAESDLLFGTVPIVSKIAFDSGLISLRAGGGTKTKMILARAGDLLVSGINAYKGAIAIVPPEQDRVAATIHYGAYQVDPDRAIPEFLWWMLRSRFFQERLEQHVPGGIKTELKAKRLLAVPVPLPSLNEQHLSLKALDFYSSLLREATVTSRRARAEANALLLSVLNRRLGQSLGSGKMSDVIAQKPRSGPSFPTSPDWQGTPVLMPSSVSGFGVDTTKVEFGLGGERIPALDRLCANDIIIARGNKREQVGNAGVVPSDCAGWVCANLLMRMSVDPQAADPHFCVYWLRSPHMRSLVQVSMKGTSPNIQKINQKTILSFPFPSHIAIVEQRQIVADLKAIEASVQEIKCLQAESAKELAALLPSILHRAFRGEL